MGGLFAKLFNYIKPIVVVFTSISGLISFLLGALADPQGWMNDTVCNVIDMFANLLPQTPANLKIGSIIDNMAVGMPLVGRGIIAEVFSTIGIIVSLVIVIKIYKLIPFKAT